MQQPWFTQYTDDIVKHATGHNLDVLHMNEIWTVEIKDKILADRKVKEEFPHHYWSPPQTGAPIGCNFDAISLLYAEEFIGCLLQSGVNTTNFIEPVPGVPDLCLNAAGQLGVYGFDPNTGSFPNLNCLGCLINVMQLLTVDQAFGANSFVAPKRPDGYSYQPEASWLLGNNSFRDVFRGDPKPTCCPASHVNFPVCVADAQPPFQSDHIYVRDLPGRFLLVIDQGYFNDLPLMSDHIGVYAHVVKIWNQGRDHEGENRRLQIE